MASKKPSTLVRCADCRHASGFTRFQDVPYNPLVCKCRFRAFPQDGEVANAMRVCKLFQPR